MPLILQLKLQEHRHKASALQSVPAHHPTFTVIKRTRMDIVLKYHLLKLHIYLQRGISIQPTFKTFKCKQVVKKLLQIKNTQEN